jgi:ribosomal protein S18 acetylase RimI-like enzyme
VSFHFAYLDCSHVDEILLLHKENPGYYYPLKNELDFRSFFEQKQSQGMGLFYDAQIKAYIISSFIFEIADVLYFLVSKPLQRKGFGLLLWEQFLMKCTLFEIDSIFLEVDTKNDTALAFYKKVGFSTLSLRQSYYPNGNDAYTMVYQHKSSKNYKALS